MAQPQPFTRTFSYTNSFAANPTQVFPGGALDAELNNVKATTDQILENLTFLQNDDGTILNGSIGAAQLSSSLQIGFTVPTVWTPGAAYFASPASTVFENNGFYSCLVSNTSSNSFSADLAAGFWVLIANLAGIPLVTANQIAITPSGGIVATDVQSAMYGLDTRITANASSLTGFTSSSITDSSAIGRTILTATSSDAVLADVNAWSTGDAKLTIKSTADTGWLMMNDGTIGSATSGATYANILALNLYTLLWNNVTNTYAPVTGGRGGSAALDWAANKPIGLLAVLGRSLAVAGSGSGLTARTLGQTVGLETQTISQANLPSVTLTTSISAGQGSHSHTTGSVFYAQIGGTSVGQGGLPAGLSGITISTNTLPAMSGTTPLGGSGTAISDMQPTSFWNVMIKL